MSKSLLRLGNRGVGTRSGSGNPLLNKLLPILLLTLAYSSATAQNTNDANAIASRVKTSYIYNFLQFISFQPDSLGENHEIQVCIVGRDGFGNALNQIDGKQISQGTIKISRLGKVRRSSSLAHCHALYLSASEAENVDQILKKVDTHQVFTISEFSSFIEHGGLVELYEYDNSIRFRINESLVKETNFKVAAQLIQLGVK